MSKRGLLIIFAGASGVGKGTIMKRLLASSENYRLSISATTRSPRQGEQDGREYYFIDRERFEEMIADGGFLEYAEYVGNLYGTPRQAVSDMLDQGIDVFLEIELKGFFQIKQSCPDCVSIFVVPPSMDELRARLTGRGTEPPEVIEARLRTAEEEIAHQELFDHIVVNDDVDRAAGEIISIIESIKNKE